MDPQIFKSNLRGLLDAKGLSQRDLAKKCMVSEDWVRRVCSRGLTRVEDRNRDQLKAICEELGISPVERLWSPDLHAVKREAAWYGAKVEEILNATSPKSDFKKSESISESSITELKRLIDDTYRAFKESQEKLARRNAFPNGKATGREAATSSRSGDVERARLVSEYPAKLGHLISNPSLVGDGLLFTIFFMIDAYFFSRQGNRVVSVLQDKDGESYEAWLTFFGDRQTLVKSVSVALSKFHEKQVLTWLTEHSAPADLCKGDPAAWIMIRKLMIMAEQESRSNSSTAGGNVSGDM